VDLLIRGERPLRTMEPDVVDLLVTEMSEMGVTWVRGETEAISAAEDGTKTLTLKGGEQRTGYDEVLFAIGRVPVTDSLDLPKTGVDTTAIGEVVVDQASKTTADDVYAVGDIITGAVQLTPVAIAAGRLLSDRLFNGVPEAETMMDYDNIPTVVFSHPTMAVMGLTEEQAIERYGADEITCHKTTFVNMLYSASSSSTSSISLRRAQSWSASALSSASSGCT